MRATTTSTLSSNRTSLLPRRRTSPSPISTDHATSHRSSSSSNASASSSSTSATTIPASVSTRSATSSQSHRRPPLRRSSPASSVDQSIAFERELQNLLEVEYRDDVEEYMYDMEARTLASVELIDMQPELQWYMRPYLVDFLIEIHQQHALRSETLYLAINIVDRYVSKRIVFKKHYQLVGCAALWIAAKFEDAKDRVPTVQELTAACCNAYEESAFIQMEGHVLSTIGWVLGHPTAEAWLRLASIGYGLEEQRVQHTSRFLMEITLFHRTFVAFKPSEIALACLVLARYMLNKQRRAEQETEEVLRIIQLLDAHLGEHLDQVSAIVIKKYSFAFYSRASTFCREWYLSGHRFCLPSVVSSPSASQLSSSPTSRATSSYGRSSSPLTSPSSESSFCSSDGCSDFDDDPEPLTPITPMSSCHLSADIDPMDCTGGTPLKENIRPIISVASWDGDSLTTMA